MRSMLLIILVIVPAAALAAELPTRKPGLWEIRMTHSGPGAGQVIKQCVDAETDAKMLQMSGSVGEQMGMTCSKKNTREHGGVYIVESDCAMAGSRTITKTVISGDFNSTYKADTTITQDPPIMGNAVTKMSQTAKWVGPCASGQEPGDVIMPNGMKMNMAQMEKISKMPHPKMPFPMKK